MCITYIGLLIYIYKYILTNIYKYVAIHIDTRRRTKLIDYIKLARKFNFLVQLHQSRSNEGIMCSNRLLLLNTTGWHRELFSYHGQPSLLYSWINIGTVKHQYATEIGLLVFHSAKLNDRFYIFHVQAYWELCHPQTISLLLQEKTNATLPHCSTNQGND